MLQMLQTLQNVANATEPSKFCRDLKYVANERGFLGLWEFFRAVGLVLRSDEDNLQSLMPFKHMPFCFCC